VRGALPVNRADWHARPGPYLPPEESRRSLLLAAVVLVIFCVAFYSLIVGLGS
jgi:hypothetical protein